MFDSERVRIEFDRNRFYSQTIEHHRSEKSYIIITNVLTPSPFVCAK